MEEDFGPTMTPASGDKIVQRRKRLKFMDIIEQKMGLNGLETIQRTVVAPKGIYKTPHGYRVQLNMESFSGRGKIIEGAPPPQHPQRGKFSRNTKKFEEAVWLYEVAILISDCPSSAHSLICHGNFEFMYAMKVSISYLTILLHISNCYNYFT